MIYGDASVDRGAELDAQAKALRTAGAERPLKLTRHRREEALAALAEGSATQADLARSGIMSDGLRFRGSHDCWST